MTADCNDETVGPDADALTATLLHFFLRFLKRDAGIMKLIETNFVQMQLTDETLRFTLQGLYEIAGKPSNLEFVAFKRLLYAGSLNAKLRETGHRITVFSPARVVDHSWYQLEKIQDPVVVAHTARRERTEVRDE